MLTRLLDDVLDRTVLLGYSQPGLAVRRRLPGWPADPPRGDGRVVLVTGATSGLGLAACEAYAALGFEVLVHGRSPGRTRDAVLRVSRHGAARPVLGDLSTRAELDRLADELGREPRLDVVVHCAGSLTAERTLTADGLELTFATNVLAPFVLTDRLAGLLARDGGGRVVNVSSGGMYARRLRVEDLQSVQDYQGVTAYARSKRAEVVLSELWAERLAGTGVVVHAMHPGWADTPGIQGSLAGFAKVTGPVLRTPAEGADTMVWLGAAVPPGERSGLFWHDRRPRPTHLLPGTRETPAERERLWAECVRLAGGLRSAGVSSPAR